MSFGQIVEGTYNNLTNRNEDLSARRLKICEACKLYLDTVFSPVCNPSLFIEPNTENVSSHKKEGYVRGCGCLLNSKTRVEQARCPGGK